MNKKICYHCKKEKSILEFYKRKVKPYGYYSYCIECSRKLNRESNRKFYKKRKIQKKAYYQLNPEKNRKKAREYAIKMKLINPARWRAKKFFDIPRKKIDKNITIDYLESLFLEIKNCQCCGKKLTLKYENVNSRKHRANGDAPSIDRVNNNCGYSKNNIAIICWECNFRKTDLTLKDLKMYELYINKYANK